MNRYTLALPLALFGCAHALQPEQPRTCDGLEDCERLYAEELAAYTACKDDHYGARCEGEESRMNGAYNQRQEAQAHENARSNAEEERVHELAREADRKAQAAEGQQVIEEREAIAAASRAEDARIEQERAAAEEAELQAVLARQSAVKEKATKLGFDSIIYLEKGGLVTYLAAVIEHGTDVKTLGKTVIELSSSDSSFEALSVQGGVGLFGWSNDGPMVFFPAPKGKTIYDGTSLTSLGVEAVKIIGVRSYRTVRGASAQAFVVAPVW